MKRRGNILRDLDTTLQPIPIDEAMKTELEALRARYGGVMLTTDPLLGPPRKPLSSLLKPPYMGKEPE